MLVKSLKFRPQVVHYSGVYNLAISPGKIWPKLKNREEDFEEIIDKKKKGKRKKRKKKEKREKTWEGEGEE